VIVKTYIQSRTQKLVDVVRNHVVGIVIVATTAEGTWTVIWFVSIAEYWSKVEAGVQYGL
jgi:hypothetical protein